MKTPLRAEVSGYSTIQSIISESTALSRNTVGLWHIANVNRLNWLTNKNNHTFEFGYEFSQLYENAIDTNLLTDWNSSKRDYRVFDLDNVLLKSTYSEIRRYLILQNLDRLSYTFRNSNFEFIIGRQQISLGVSKLISPIDIFSPFDLVTLNTEERKGVDAIRYRKTIGEMGEVEAAVLLGENLDDDKSAAFIRYIHFLENLELSPFIGRYKTALTIGGDFLLTTNGANLYFETLYSMPPNEDEFFRATLGGEYQVSEKLFLALEFHHNGAGESNKDDYKSLSNNFFYKSGAISFYGKNYLNALFSFKLSDLDSLGITSFVNLNDTSILVSPSWNKSLSDNSSLSIAAFFGLGDNGTSYSSTGKSKKKVVSYSSDEFSNYGKSLHTKFIYYF